MYDYETGVQNGVTWTLCTLGTLAVVLWMGYLLHSCSNQISHERLGRANNPCFANKTCRENLRCADNGSEAGVCVKK